MCEKKVARSAVSTQGLREALDAAVLIAQHADAEGVDTVEPGRHRFPPVDVAGSQAVGEQSGHRLVDVAGRQRHGVAVRRGDLFGQLGGGHAGEAGGAQPGFGIVQHQPPRSCCSASM